MEFEDKIVLCCSREAKCKKRFNATILYELYNCLDCFICINNCSLMVSTDDSHQCGHGSFPRRGVYEFTFQLFK